MQLAHPYNQQEVDSYDQLIWRNEREVLRSRIATFCANNKCSFSFDITLEAIQNSQHDVVILMWLFDLIPDFNFWQQADQKCKELGKKCFVVTDNILSFTDLDLIKFYSYPELLGVTASYSNVDSEPTSPTRLYNCFIQRVDSVRQSWFYFLYDNKLLDRGYVSLLMKQLADVDLTNQELFDYIHYNYQLDRLPKFHAAYQAMRPYVPFRNFEESNNLLPLIQDSKYSLVLETYATDDDYNAWCFTEKSLRTLQFATIPLLFMQKHSIQKLKELGFLIGNYLDHIDNETWIARQSLLLDILVQDSIDFVWHDLYNNSQYNRALLADWQRQYQKSNFFDNLFDKVKQH